MHSSIQFRHKAISTYGRRRLRSLWLFRSNNTSCRQWYVLILFFFEGRNLQMETGHRELDASLFFNLSGLDCVSLIVLLQVVCLLRLVSQAASVCLSLGSKVVDSHGTEMMWITLICGDEGGSTMIRGSATTCTKLLSVSKVQDYNKWLI